jgi:predicted deacylase
MQAHPILANSSPMRTVVDPAGIDFSTPGRRDYLVRFEHPTMWGDYRVPVSVFVGRDAKPGHGLLATGSVHGNEFEGPVALKNLLSEIDPSAVRGRIVLIPVLNVSAFAAGKRDTPDDGMNLNRAFPGDAQGSISKKFASFVHDQVFPHVHVVIDIHSGGDIRFTPCSSFHHVDDPCQRAEMEIAARGFGCRFTMIYQNQTAGLLTSTAERLGKITIGTELGWGDSIQREGVSMGRQGVLAAAIRSGQLAGPIPESTHYRGDDQILVDNSDLACYLTAPFTGHFEPRVDCGAFVKAGQVVGRMHDFERIDVAATDILAPHDGYLICHAWSAKNIVGKVIAVVSKPVNWTIT